MKNALTIKKPFGIHSEKARKVIFDITCYLYIALYLYTAYDKLTDYTTFQQVLSKSELLGAFSVYIARGLPLIEITIGILLILPWTRIMGVWAATGLMVLFTLYLIYMLLFSNDRICHCGGFISQLSWTEHLFFNLAFVVLGTYALYINKAHNDKRPLEIK